MDMLVGEMSNAKFKSYDSPFTELLNLLRSTITMDGRAAIFSFDLNQLELILQQIDNIVSVLLQGLQSLGNLMSIAAQSKSASKKEFIFTGYFISIIGNLVESLNILKMDIDVLESG